MRDQVLTRSSTTMARVPNTKMGIQAGSGDTVSGRARLRNFNDALGRLPGGVPVNVILFPMVGDAAASTAYWRLAQQTNGSYISPSRDWP
jgi:hypothetical protein